MKSLSKIVIWLVGAYLALMLGTGLVAKLLLSGSQIDNLVASAQSRVPVELSVGQGGFDLFQWMLLRPAVTVSDASIGNPEGFSSAALIEAEEVSLQISLLSLFQDQIDVSAFALREPHLTIERNRAGRTNLAAFFETLSQSRQSSEEAEASEGSSGKGLAVDRFLLESGTVEFFESGKTEPSLSVHDIDLVLEDFSADDTCKLSLGAGLFESASSRLEFAGRVGPLRADSVPAEGDLSVELAPADVPEDLRSQYAGNVLGDPGGDSLIALEASMKGDLLGRLAGSGQLSLSDLEVGRDEEHRLALVGEAPFDLAVEKALSAPSFTLELRDSSLQLGEGRWKGKVDLSYAGTRFRGGSSGAVHGVRIDELLSAFTESEDTVFAKGDIPRYRLRFAGRKADEIRDSLTGDGRITLSEGWLSLFDLLDTIERHANKLLGGESAAAGETDFVQAESLFEIRNQQVYLSNLVLENSSSNITGGGYFTFDEQLHFDLETNVLGGLSSTLGSLLGAADRSGPMRIPVRIRGTFQDPKIRPDMGGLVQQAGGLLDLIFKKPQQEAQPEDRPEQEAQAGAEAQAAPEP